MESYLSSRFSSPSPSPLLATLRHNVSLDYFSMLQACLCGLLFLGDVAPHLLPITEKEATHSSFPSLHPHTLASKGKELRKLVRSAHSYHILSPSPLITSLHEFFPFFSGEKEKNFQPWLSEWKFRWLISKQWFVLTFSRLFWFCTPR